MDIALACYFAPLDHHSRGELLVVVLWACVISMLGVAAIASWYWQKRSATYGSDAIHSRKMTNMFDLEKSISSWRQQMLAVGIQSPVPLEELEIHLREEIERQMRSGTEAQPAIEAAIQKMGRIDALKHEFQKTHFLTVERIRIKVIAGGVLTFLVGLVMLWAAVVQNRDVGKMTGETIGLFGLGLILVFDGAAIGILASKRNFLAAGHKA